MSVKRAKKPTQTQEPKDSVVSGDAKNPSSPPKIGLHLAETAWRVALPFMGFSLIGIWADERYESDPVFTLIGIALGLIGAGLMVYRFVKRNYPDTFKQDRS